MATPNAAGVAALIVSQYGDFKDKGKEGHMSPGRLEHELQQAANNQECPDPATVVYPMPPGPGLPLTATCQGGAGQPMSSLRAWSMGSMGGSPHWGAVGRRKGRFYRRGPEE